MANNVYSTPEERASLSSDQSSRFLETLINLSPDILYIYDLNKQINIYSNDGISRNLGYSINEIRQMGNQLIKTLMHPEDFETYLRETVPRYWKLENDEPLIHQYRMKHKDGSWHHLESNEVIYARNPDDSPSQIFGEIHDITTQKQITDDLKRSKEYIENIINTANTLVVGLDLDGNISIFNATATKITGYTKKDLQGKNWFEVLVPKDRYPEVWQMFSQVSSEGLPQKFENPILTKSGEERFIIWQNSIVYQDDTPAGTISFGLDITERQKSETSAREAHQFSQAIIKSAHEGIVVYDKNLNYQVWNPFMEEITGIKSEDIIGKKPLEIFPELDDLGVFAQTQKALRGEYPPSEEFYFQVREPHRWIVNTSAPLRNSEGDIIGVIATVQDITDRKTAELRERESEEKYRALFSTMTQGVVYQDAEGMVINANPAAENILGLSLDQMQGRTSMDPQWRTIREDGSEFPGELHPISIALKTGKEVKNVVHGIFNPNKNALVWIKVSAVPLIRPGDTKPYQAYAIIEDITEQKTSEQNYRMLFREMLDGFALHEMIYDAKGDPVDYRFIDVNPSFERMTGLKREDIIGKTVLTIMPNTEEFWIQRYGKIVETGEPNSFENFSAELGKHFEVTAFRPAPHRFACIFADVTQRKKTEELLKNTQKLESPGVLAGGIAHDFNNLLGGIYGYIDLASEMSGNTQVSSCLEKSLTTIDRARNLTRQLLTFAKGGEPIRKVDSLFPFVQETAEFALSGSNVSLTFDIAQDLRQANFDKNQLGQVIENIVINAQQAMPMGGAITLTAENITAGVKEHPILDKGLYCKISIQDNGVGIPQEYLLKIFDPFFTTKAKGHGLGLATCYSIISRHGGCIDVESTQGKGTTFHLFLPAADTTTTPETGKKSTVHKGHGTFMIMDDEPVIQDTLTEMLTSFGYTVITKDNGEDVVGYFSEQTPTEQGVAGLFLDLTIPGGMGGKDVAQEIRRRDKNVPLFVVSGYAEDPVIANPGEHGFTASICKPFRTSELSDLLNTYLQ